MAAVEPYGILGRPKRGVCAPRVLCITGDDIPKHLGQGAVVAASCKLLVPAHGADFGRCVEVHLQVGIGEHHRADVAAIEDRARAREPPLEIQHAARTSGQTATSEAA